MGETYLTQAGLTKLSAECKSLLKQKRKLTEEVSKAAALGDLRENAEYHAAREKLEHVSARILELDSKLVNVKLIDGLTVKAGEVRVGVTVTLEEQETKERVSYQMVGPGEANPQDGKLSIASPLGKSLLGKKKGEKFTLTLPRATVPYKVISLASSG